MNLVKRPDGLYECAYPADAEKSAKIKEGQEVYATHQRNPMFHRKFFGLLQLGFNSQDVYDSFDIFRYVTVIKAGFIVWATDKKGEKHPFPESLAFDKMTAERFEEVYKAVREVIAKEAKLNNQDIEDNLENFY